jgi:hypothetical protein
MCEKCATPEIHQLTHQKDFKPLQKKLNTTSLKGKIKRVKTTLK